MPIYLEQAMTYHLYRITNKNTGRTYIGLTQGPVAVRFGRHMSRLASRTHHSEAMQLDYDAGHAFEVESVASLSGKDVAMAAEMQLAQSEPEPYNVKTGRRGDMSHVLSTSRKFNKNYIYPEVIALRGKLKQDAIAKRYGISQSMVTLIQNGHRTADHVPETSFAEVFCDTDTVVRCPASM